MNDTKQEDIKTNADRILGLLCDSIEAVRDFSIEQVPDTVRQLVAYKRVELTVWMLVGFGWGIFSIAAVCASVHYSRSFSAAASGVDFVIAFISGVLGVLSFIISVITLGDTVSEWLKLLLAPKVFILEYLRGALK